MRIIHLPQVDNVGFRFYNLSVMVLEVETWKRWQTAKHAKHPVVSKMLLTCLMRCDKRTMTDEGDELSITSFKQEVERSVLKDGLSEENSERLIIED